MICHNCKSEFGEIAGYRVTRLADVWDFCGRRCLIDHLGSEVKKAIVVGQWVPTPDEEERMGQ